ncbi:phosphoribosylanthranilate isomerase [Desulfonispora thiosulfatigenes DSM 11270]|uniref:N-(5'-phosphoribosyl)anthranilate isomerase n=1 Tax=Desulfonispora thiosulfatigenes DSM 11270 TaxID=656914 RepID=A0A1W1VAG4_DESTI|nr:phosphoribosylanthranilate isomerase [Desulfonispora thiosulfatigenes]SMB90409.1 phosphoribosylanthranilate isomerase [Desulfonispora thiosulfatigenes DSM 11270]
MTWIKICGITNIPDAKLACSLGADALGFIFAPSTRKVNPKIAQEIIKDLPFDVEKIGVFMDEDIKVVQEIAEYCGLTGLQFHGKESPKYCKNFAKYKVIKSFRIKEEQDLEKTNDYLENVDLILLDTYVPAVPGGTGKTFPWEIARKQVGGGVPVIIAGGINASNVNKAIRVASPFGIDIGSGVESEPGKKDKEKLSKLFKTLNSKEEMRYE